MKQINFLTFLLILTFAACLLPPPLLHAADSTSDVSETPSIENIKSKLLDKQKKIQRLKQGVLEQKEKIRRSRTQEVRLLTELEQIDMKIKEVQQRITDLKAELAAQEKDLIEKQSELADVTKKKEQIRDHVEKRLAAFYRMGSIGLLNATFSSTSLPELLNFREYFKQLVRYDRRVIDEYKIRVSNLQESQLSLKEEMDSLLLTIEKIEKEEKHLAEVKNERIELLTRVNTEKKLFQRALDELEEAAAEVTATIEKLKQESAKIVARQKKEREIAKKKRPAENNDFAERKGRLNPPVRGKVVTYFGRNTKGKFGITTYANGINIKAEPGSEIKAIFDGKVAYSGRLRGYGNLLIIDHGNNYYSLVSRAETFLKHEGEHVSEGEVIGYLGDETGLLNEGLHFEIRHGTEPLNPLHWVNNGVLVIEARNKD